MATTRDEYYTNILDSLLGNNGRQGTPQSSKKLQEAASRVMAETEDKVKDARCNINNVTMDTFSVPRHDQYTK